VSVFGVQVGVRMWVSGLGCWVVVVVVVVGVGGGVASSGRCWGVGGGGGGSWLSGRERERVERGRVNRIIYFYMSAVSTSISHSTTNSSCFPVLHSFQRSVHDLQ